MNAKLFRIRVPALLLALTLLLSACGGGRTAAAPDAAGTSSGAAAHSAETQTPASPESTALPPATEIAVPATEEAPPTGTEAPEPAAPTEDPDGLYLVGVPVDLSQVHNDRAEAAIRGFCAQPCWEYELLFTQDPFPATLDGEEEPLQIRTAGELQWDPFVFHAHISAAEDTTSQEEYLAAFGDGSFSSLFFSVRQIEVTGRPSVDGFSSCQLCVWPQEELPDSPAEHTFPLELGDYASVNWQGTRYSPIAILFLPFIGMSLFSGTDYQARETVSLNGRPALRLDGRLSEEALEVISFDLEASTPSEFAENALPLPDVPVPVSLWVDAETGLPLRVSLDCTEYMRSGITELMRYTIRSEFSKTLSGAELDRRVEGQLKLLLLEFEINEVSFTLDLRPGEGPVSVPMELPTEEERMTMLYRTVPRYQDYAMVKRSDSFSPTAGQEIPPELERSCRQWFHELREAGRRSSLRQLDGQDWLVRLDTPELGTVRAVQAEAVCRAGAVEEQIGTCTLLGGRCAFQWDAEVPEGLEQAAAAAIQAGGQAGEFSYDGLPCSFSRVSGKTYTLSRTLPFAYVGEDLGPEFRDLALKALEQGETELNREGKTYYSSLNPSGTVQTFWTVTDSQTPLVLTTLRAHPVRPGSAAPADILQAAAAAILSGQTEVVVQRQRFAAWVDAFGAPAVADGTGTELPVVDGAFESGGRSYTVELRGDDCVVLDAEGQPLPTEPVVLKLVPLEDGWQLTNSAGAEFARLLNWSVTRYSGADSLPLQVKLELIEAVEQLEQAGQKEGSATVSIPENAVSYDPELEPQDTTTVQLVRYITGEYVVRTTLYQRILDLVKGGSPSD